MHVSTIPSLALTLTCSKEVLRGYESNTDQISFKPPITPLVYRSEWIFEKFNISQFSLNNEPDGGCD
jgi:hypothetical protein